jgi:hypothetical protein
MIQANPLVNGELCLRREINEVRDAVSQEQLPTFGIQFEADGIAGQLGQSHQLLPSFGPPCLAACSDRIRDPVGQQFVLFGPCAFLEVVGHVGICRLAGNSLAALPGEQDERKIGVILTDCLKEFAPIRCPKAAVVTRVGPRKRPRAGPRVGANRRVRIVRGLEPAVQNGQENVIRLARRDHDR